MSILQHLQPQGSLKNVTDSEIALGQLMSEFRNDPLGFVRTCYHWGEGDLSEEQGPDEWQSDFLTQLGEQSAKGDLELASAIRMCVTSGHGVGKTAMVSWIIQWFISTRPNSVIVVTANTQAQLTTKTWRELAKWHTKMVHRHWFEWTATKFYHVLYPDIWYANAVPWSKDNSEAFAGTHEKTGVLIIFDEASAIDDIIWEVAEGAMTTPGAIWCVFGNPTRNDGRFFECFNRYKHRWIPFKVDSRKAKAANQAQLQDWIDDYGEDSDFVRVRVRGEFPRLAANQFISNETVLTAQHRYLERDVWASKRPIIGVDVARMGDDASIICVRQGNHVHEIKSYLGIDTMELAGYVVDSYREFGSHSVICVDGVGVGAGVIDRLRQMNLHVIDVQSAASPKDARAYSNMRGELWGMMRDWLINAGDIPKTDRELSEQLRMVQYSLNNKLQTVLQSKKDLRKSGKGSPDRADALAYTFAYDEAVSFVARAKARDIRKVTWT